MPLAAALRTPRPGRVLRLASVAVLGFSAIAGLLAIDGYTRETRGVVEESRLLARGAAADLDRHVRSQFGTLLAVAATQGFAEGNLDRIRTHLDRIDPDASGFNGGIFWVDMAGFLRARTEYAGPPLDFSDRDYVNAVLGSGRPVVGAARIGQVNQGPVVPLAVPSRGLDGAVNGVVAGAIRLDALPLDTGSLGRAGINDVLVIDRSGRIIVGTGPSDVLAWPNPDFELEGVPTPDGAVHRGPGPREGTEQLVGYAVAPAADWLILIDRPVAEAFGPARWLLLVQLATVTGAAVLVAALLLWAARRIDGSDAARERASAAQALAYESERAVRQRLEVAVADLRHREALRDAFVGVISHELRTPVTTIYGVAKLLAKSPDGPARASLVQDIDEESDRLFRIAEDLLVLSRAERGALHIDPEPVLIQRVAAPLVDDVQRRFPQSRIATRIQGNLAPVASEAGPLRQVLNNLLINAAKYGRGADIRLTAEEQGAWVIVTVEDDGPGFPPDQATRLFELFYRVPGTVESTAGTGIGLYIVQQLVQAMGGDVEAYEVQPHGAGFRLTLPIYGLDRAAHAASRTAAGEVLQRMPPDPGEARGVGPTILVPPTEVPATRAAEAG
jgi:signal transduction histidine kinase